MEFEAIIGLELHIEMKTKSKLFSSAPVSFGEHPNTNVALLDMGFPGVLPLVNKQVIINAIRVANALHMDIDDTIVFDRKNYFYSDLPKGYQITQEFRPLGREGFIKIDDKVIRLQRLHIEEDTCKQIHYSDYSLLDYNRAGIPLIEIVTYPDFTNGVEAAGFVEKIRSIVTFLDVSDGKMEEASLRCDINISLHEKGNDKYGTKVEIKNLNSISNIQKAIEYEISRQSTALENGKNIKQETRRFDEKSKKTVLMRTKVDSVDYKCFVDSNIPPIKLDKSFIQEAIESSNELPDQKAEKYLALGLSKKDTDRLVMDKDTSLYYDEMINAGVNPKLACNWLLMDVQSYLNKHNIDINSFPIRSIQIVELINMVESHRINNKQAKELFAEMIETGDSVNNLISKYEVEQINDENELVNIIDDVLNKNQELIKEYKNGKEKVLKYLIGQVMINSHNKANPELANKLLIQEIKRR